MRGHIRKRGQKWAVVVLDLGRGEDGRRQQRWHSGFHRRRDAERKLAEILGRLESGSYVEADKVSLGDYLTRTWLPAIGASVRPSTLARYRLDVETKLVPRLGSIPLQKLNGAHLDALYAELLEEGLSPSSVRHVHVVAHRALRDAERNDLVTRNAATRATPPRIPRKELSVWSAEQLREFLAAVEGDRLYAAWWLLGTAGLRRGEVLGLRWRDLNRETRRLAVVRSLTQRGTELAFAEPKTKRGRRNLALDERSMAILEAHRRRQLEERIALGLGRPAAGRARFHRPARRAGEAGLVLADVRPPPARPRGAADQGA